MKIAAIIVAAGRGTRAGAGLPKQWRQIANAPVALHTVRAFLKHPQVTRCLLVIHPDDHSFASDIADVELIHGGASRDASVQAGLEALSHTPPDLVLIHDVARPLVSHSVIDNVLAALKNNKAAAPALPVTDALWHGKDGMVTGTQNREGLFRAQTPQGFHFVSILAAHRAHTGGAADDVEVARHFGLDVAITLGDEANMKITSPNDFARAERIILQQAKD
jgi:2-C-methyl-D-erythritol 4-phosphate cytidylyltransferase